MDWKSHDGIEGAFDPANSPIAYPFLDTIGAGFIEWVVVADVLVDLFVR